MRTLCWLCSLCVVCLVACDPAGSEDAGPVGADAGLDAGAGDRDAGVRDAGDRDGGGAPLDGGGVDGGPPAPLGPVLYPADTRHSPLTSDIAAHGPALFDDRLMKVGDSITVSSSFLHCFEGSVDLDGRPLDATVARFAGWWVRTSLSATVGWSAFAPLMGDPRPLDEEHAATQARFATLMFGTNDAGFRAPQTFARDLWAIAETLVERGTVPLMSTIPPRDDDASANANVPLYNLAIRAIAQGLGVPLIDFHRELAPLPGHGLGSDGVHPRAFGGGCVFTAEGLERGYNVRNSLTLEQLDRAARGLDGEALDTDAPRLLGAGTASDPFLVPALPFAAMGVSDGGDRGIDTYACSPANEGGPSRVYRVEVPRAGRLTALALSDVGVDVDVHLLDGAITGDACLTRDDTIVTADVTPGTWYVVADTFVGSSGERPGRFLVAVSLE